MPCRNVEVDVLENLGSISAIAEVDRRQLDGAAGGREVCHAEALTFGRRIEDVAETADRDLHLLEILPELRETQHRLRRLVHDHVEGDEAADGQLVLDHRACSEEKHGGRRQLAHELNRILSNAGDDDGFEGGAHVGGEPLLPLVPEDRLHGSRLERLHAEHRLDQELLACGARIETLVDLVPQNRPHHHRDQHIERQRDEHHQRQLDRVGEEDGKEHESEKEVDYRGKALSGEKAADRLELAHARDGLPSWAGLEVGEGQPKQMVEQPAAKLDVDAARRMAQRVRPEKLQQTVENRDQHETGHDHDQGRQAFVNEHLVDDHLEQQGGSQRE